MTPPEGTKYVSISAGEDASFFLRDDGVVDKYSFP
jgi:hypothetical protein